jgi:hypothetical protein
MWLEYQATTGAENSVGGNRAELAPQSQTTILGYLHYRLPDHIDIDSSAMVVRLAAPRWKTCILAAVAFLVLRSILNLYGPTADVPVKTGRNDPERAGQLGDASKSSSQTPEQDHLDNGDFGPMRKEIVLVVGTDGRGHNTEEMDNMARENRQEYADFHGTPSLNYTNVWL